MLINYHILLSFQLEQKTVPAITATAADYKASISTTTASDLTQQTVITVTAEESTISKVYTINYNVPPKKEVIFVTSPANSNDSVVIASVAGYKDSSIYNVTVLEQDVITIDSLDFFNAADVIIMGRSINSGNVGAARAAWDSISAPVISTNMWGLRGRTDKGCLDTCIQL